MLEFIGGAVIVYFIFKVLAAVFTRKPSEHTYVIREKGRHFVIRKYDLPAPREKLIHIPDNVVPFRR